MIVTGKRRNKFGDPEHKLPLIMLNYKVLKGGFVPQLAGILGVGKIAGACVRWWFSNSSEWESRVKITVLKRSQLDTY